MSAVAVRFDSGEFILLSGTGAARLANSPLNDAHGGEIWTDTDGTKHTYLNTGSAYVDLTTAAGTAVVPAQQVAFGNAGGTGVTSSADLTFDPAADKLQVGATVDPHVTVAQGVFSAFDTVPTLRAFMNGNNSTIEATHVDGTASIALDGVAGTVGALDAASLPSVALDGVGRTVTARNAAGTVQGVLDGTDASLVLTDATNITDIVPSGIVVHDGATADPVASLTDTGLELRNTANAVTYALEPDTGLETRKLGANLGANTATIANGTATETVNNSEIQTGDQVRVSWAGDPGDNIACFFRTASIVNGVSFAVQSTGNVVGGDGVVLWEIVRPAV